VPVSPGGCADGPEQVVVVTVNPTPQVVPVPDTQTIFNDGTTNIMLTSPSTFSKGVITFRYTVVATGGVTGFTASATGLPRDHVISDVLHNPTDAPQTVTYTIVPVSPGGCADGPPKIVIILVNPTPRLYVTAVADTLCNNETSVFTVTTPTVLTSGNVVFNYTIDAASGGLGIISGYTTADGVVLQGPGPVTFTQTLINHTNEVQWVTFRIHPYAKDTGSGSDCDHGAIRDTLITLLVEPTAKVTGSISKGTICNNEQITYTLSSPTTAIHGVRFNVTVINPYPEISGLLNRVDLTTSSIINETPSNSGDIARMIMYVISPATITGSGIQKCIGINDTIRLWINPTPRVVPVNVNPICYGGATNIVLNTPSVMTGGIINFDYTVSVTGGPGIIVGNTGPGNDLLPGQNISRSYQNNSDTIQSVYFYITPSNDFLGCVGTLNVPEIKVHAEPLQSLFISQPLTCDGGSDASLTAILSKGATPLEVRWRGPSGYTLDYYTNDHITEVTNLRGGGYQVTVTDNLGCAKSLNAWPVGARLDSYFAVQEKSTGLGTTCPGSNDGVIRIRENNSSTGVPPYEYWIVYNGQDTVIHDFLNANGVFNWHYNLPPGNYKLYIKDSNECFDNSFPEVDIIAPEKVIVTFDKAEFQGGFNISCRGYSDGLVSVASITGGNGGYSYFWYPASGPPLTVTTNTSVLDSIPAGKYYLRTTDLMGCIKIDSVYLTEPDGMVLTGSTVSQSPDASYNISCHDGNDGSIKLSITGGSGIYTYLWTGPDGYNATTRDISGLKAGTYSCEVKDLNGCILIPVPVFTLTEPPELAITLISSVSTDGFYNINCFGGTGFIDITVTGGSAGNYNYVWTTINGSGIVTGQEDQYALTAGSYRIVVTDANNCTVTADITLTEPSEISAVLTPKNITCQSATFDDGSIDLMVMGGVLPYSFSWSNGAVSEDISGLAEGYYRVTITDLNGCQVIDSVRISLPPPLIYSKVVSDFNGYNISCSGLSNGSIQIFPTSGLAPYTYNWQMPDGTVRTTKDLSDLKSGRYILFMTDSNFCTARDTFDLTEPGKISMIITPSTSISGGYNINCAGAGTGSVIVEALNNAGPVAYIWADGGLGRIRTDLTAGNYRIIITDSNNCQADSTVTLTDPEPIKLEFAVTQPFCTDLPNGTIDVTTSGGEGLYTYLWSDNSTTPGISVPSGWYSVVVKDDNGCAIKDSVKVEPLNEACLVIPNAISPNGDLINDEWNIGLKELYPQMEITIFNRWGEVVWKSGKGYPRPWDGRSNGTILPIDSYHYIINLHNGRKPIIGHVTIVR
jgi:gliding motility-associated-like protein